MTEPKWATCVNCLEQIDFETYMENDHVCTDCAWLLGAIIDGTAERIRD